MSVSCALEGRYRGGTCNAVNREGQDVVCPEKRYIEGRRLWKMLKCVAALVDIQKNRALVHRRAGVEGG